MQYEMSLSFQQELNKISLITAIAILLVVLIAFRSPAVPVILVLLIQSAVYAVMVLMTTVFGSKMYYLALLVVQSILMGATIDYGVLFTNYYREKRKEMDIPESLRTAYESSIHTILTSGMIMVFATWILGYAFEDPSVGQICHLIALGVITALILIIFILPGVIAAFDKFTCGIRENRPT